jgi:leader peptidase (prepilin peptidase)/N-methyltransferase
VAALSAVAVSVVAAQAPGCVAASVPEAAVVSFARGMDAVTLVGCLGVAAVTPALVRYDVTRRRLPNVLVGVAAGAWTTALVLLVLRGEAGIAATSLGWFGVIAVVGLIAAVGGGLGMGDVKLGAVLTGLASPAGPTAVLCLWGIAGVLAVVLAGGGRTLSASRRRRRGADRPAWSRGIPFGPCLLASYWTIVVGLALSDGGIVAGPPSR